MLERVGALEVLIASLWMLEGLELDRGRLKLLENEVTDALWLRES